MFAVIVSDIERAKASMACAGQDEVPDRDFQNFPKRVSQRPDHCTSSRARRLIPESAARASTSRILQAAARVLQADGYPVLWETMKITGLDRFSPDPDHNRIEIMASDRK